MVQELRIVQRSSFRLFLAILVIPVVLLVAAVAAVLADDVDCAGMGSTPASSSQIGAAAAAATSTISSSSSNGTATAADSQSVMACWNEQRSFRNAFTTRCICDSVPASTANAN